MYLKREKKKENIFIMLKGFHLIISINTITLQCLQSVDTVEPLSTDMSLMWTPLYYGQFSMSRQNSHIFSFKETSIIQTLSNTDNGH